MRNHFTPKDIERFWSKVDTSGGDDACWMWQASTVSNEFPYGRFQANYKRFLAHRYSWMITNGPIDDGMFVCHKCDRPRCVNPTHLFLGTQDDNMRDMLEKGRQPKGAKGELHNMAKLTTEEVMEIRTRYATGDIMRRELASEYGVSLGAVCDIIYRRSWRHVK